MQRDAPYAMHLWDASRIFRSPVPGESAMSTVDHVRRFRHGIVSSFWHTPTLLLCLASFFWALNPIVGRAIRDDLTPVTIGFWRWLIAAACVLPFAWPHLRDDLPAIRRSWPFLGLLGFFGVGVFSLLVYSSLQLTTATNNLLLQSTMPIMTLVMPAVIFRERVALLHFACAGLSILGVAWFMTKGQLANLRLEALNTGDLLALAAVFLYAAYATSLRKAPQLHHLSLLVVLFAAGIVSLAIPYALHLLLEGPSALSLTSASALVFIGIFPSLVSYALFNRAVALIGSMRAGIYMNLPAVFGVLMAVPLLGERFEQYHVLGSLIIIASILLSRKVKK
uniref:DMT family permease n=2 Tax=Alphaproteobacteria TaxID=28211 RepID=G4WYQ3_9SPHN|nr:DMT family permease [Novosphingobium sp. TVG9-VII]